MKKLAIFASSFILTLCLIISISGCSGGFGTPVTGNSKLETRTFDLVGFNRLEISNAFQVEATKADSFAISVTADSNLFQDYLDIRKAGSTLHIGLKTNHSYFNTTQRATLTMPDLRGIDVSGASKARIIGFSSTTALSMEVSGASNLDLSNIKAGNTNLEVSGASHIKGELEITGGNFNISGASTLDLNGKANNINAEISGASSGKLENFYVVEARITASGASNATVNVSGDLSAEVSGASRVYYLGNPKLGSVNVTGASTFTKR